MGFDISGRDRDLMIRTVIGEAGNQPELGKRAVAAVVLNRLGSGRFGGSMDKVLFAPKQFEPWNTRKAELMAYSPDSAKYKQAAASVDAILGGAEDPTRGATHFANVGTVADRGNKTAMGWLSKMSNVTKIGAHTFGNADGKGSGGYGDVRVVDTGDDTGGGSMGGSGGGGASAGGASEPMPDLMTHEGWQAALAQMAEPTDDPRRLAIRGMFGEALGLTGGASPDAGGGSDAPAPTSAMSGYLSDAGLA